MGNWLGAPRPLASFERVMQAQFAVAEVMGVKLLELCSAERGNARAVFARQAAMYLCHLAFKMGWREIACGFGRTYSTVRHAIQRMEEAREDPELDRVLHWLEGVLRRSGAGHG